MNCTSTRRAFQCIQSPAVSLVGLVVGVSSSSLISPEMLAVISRSPFPKDADESKKGEGVVSGSMGKGRGLGGIVVPLKIERSRARACCVEE